MAAPVSGHPASLVGTWKASGAGAQGSIALEADGTAIWLNGQKGTWLVLGPKTIRVMGAKGSFELTGTASLIMAFPGAMPPRKFDRVQ